MTHVASHDRVSIHDVDGLEKPELAEINNEAQNEVCSLFMINKPRRTHIFQAYTAQALYPSVSERALLWKHDLRIVPLSAGIYFLCYLDRSNIGNAKILNSSTHDDMMSETNMTNYEYTIALMIFLVAYGLFEVPSNSMTFLVQRSWLWLT